MIETAKKIKVLQTENGETVKRTLWPRLLSVGSTAYDVYGRKWEVCEDVYFAKFWFREVVIKK